MSNSIDKRFIDDKFLLTYFPSPTRFQEISNPLGSTLAASEQRYLRFKKDLNQKRQRSGHSPLSDADIATFIESAEGILMLSKALKRF